MFCDQNNLPSRKFKKFLKCKDSVLPLPHLLTAVSLQFQISAWFLFWIRTLSFYFHSPRFSTYGIRYFYLLSTYSSCSLILYRFLRLVEEVVIIESNEHKVDHFQAAASEHLTSATLDYQAEIVCLISLQKFTSKTLMKMELQLRSLGKPAFKSSRTTSWTNGGTPGLTTVKKFTLSDKFFGSSSSHSWTGSFNWSSSLSAAPNFSTLLSTSALQLCCDSIQGWSPEVLRNCPQSMRDILKISRRTYKESSLYPNWLRVRRRCTWWTEMWWRTLDTSLNWQLWTRSTAIDYLFDILQQTSRTLQRYKSSLL